MTPVRSSSNASSSTRCCRLRIRRDIGDLRGVAVIEAELASTYLWQGRHDEALRHYRESVEQWQIIGTDSGRTTMNSLARSFLRRDHNGPADLAGAKAEILFHSAQILLRAGDRLDALTHAREALGLAERDRPALADQIRFLVRELESQDAMDVV